MCLNMLQNNKPIRDIGPLLALTNNLICKGDKVMASHQLALFQNYCKIKGCPQIAKKMGMCYRHYEQVHSHGRVFGNPSRTRMSPNTYRIHGPVTYIQMYDDHGWPTTQAIIDSGKINVITGIKWRATKKGYVRGVVNVGDKQIEWGLHHAVLGIPAGTQHENSLAVDHENRNPLDNRVCNLRNGTYSHNGQNSTKQVRKGRPTTSKFKGVSWNTIEKKWKASITKDSKPIHLGWFSEEVEAAKTYDKKALEIFGEYALTNKMMDLFKEVSK